MNKYLVLTVFSLLVAQGSVVAVRGDRVSYRKQQAKKEAYQPVNKAKKDAIAALLDGAKGIAERKKGGFDDSRARKKSRARRDKE